MLFLLALVHLLSMPGGALAVTPALNARNPADSCDDLNNCRKLLDIIRGCLATIFACTWISVHPNVPPPGQSRLVLFWLRLKMMLITVIAPEVMVGFSARQFWAARTLSNEYGFSNTHALFFCMGGFVSSTGYPVVMKKQLAPSDENPTLGPKFLADIHHIDAEDIRDKSKGDALSKSVALIQSVWFIAQCVARVYQHLAVTELEVATLAFAVLNMFIWMFWWNKPLDVQRQIVVGPRSRTVNTEPMASVRVGPTDRLRTVLFGFIDSPDYDDLESYTSVTSFWSLPERECNDLKVFGALGIEVLLGIVFGGIHCAAWNLDFPTAEEMWIWRSCSLLVVATPVLSFLLFLIVKPLLGDQILRFMGGTVVLVYVMARLLLIVLPLVALRGLPPGAFVDVNWSSYIPHL